MKVPMTKNELASLCEELRKNLQTHEWSFDTAGFMKQAQKKATPEHAREVLDELRVVWLAWYLEWTVKNSPSFDI